MVKISKTYIPNLKEKYMCEKHKAYFKRKLTEWKSEIIKANNEALYNNSLDNNGTSADIVDQASSYTEKNVEMRAINRQIKLISKIDKAIKKIEGMGLGDAKLMVGIGLVFGWQSIPFVLFVSTREIGKHGYMTWNQIKEVDASNLVTVGNHSHSHEYLIDWKDDKIKYDLETSIKIFKKELGYSPIIFSYPFGEYSSNLKKIVQDLNFKYAFGQHSGVIDQTKDFLELPRFPINEKYGELKRFKSILSTLPFPYENITPEDRYLEINENPPKVKIKFFEDLINIKNINCYSNEGNIWRKSDIKFLNENELLILLKDKFKSERGRINCSLWVESGKWRWLGIQYVIAEY